MLEKIKTMFIDLDGTLLNDEWKMSKYTMDVIKKTAQNGINVILCSGRANSDMVEISKNACASPFVISSGGTIVFDYANEKKIFEDKIDMKYIIDIWKYAKENNIGMTCNSAYKRFKNNMSNKEAILVDDITQVDKDITLLAMNSDNYENMDKLRNLIRYDYKELEVKNFWQKPFEALGDELIEMDIMNKFNNKGKAVEKLIDFLGIDKSETMCFGNQINDIPIFKNCNIKVAMKNGKDEVKQYADFVTSYTNNEDGVAKFIEEYFGRKYEKKY